MDPTYTNHVHMDQKHHSLPSYYKKYSTSNNDIRAAVAPSNLTTMVKVNEKYDRGVYLKKSKENVNPLTTMRTLKIEEANINTIRSKTGKTVSFRDYNTTGRRIKQVIPGLLVESQSIILNQPGGLYQVTVGGKSALSPSFK